MHSTGSGQLPVEHTDRQGSQHWIVPAYYKHPLVTSNFPVRWWCVHTFVMNQPYEFLWVFYSTYHLSPFTSILSFRSWPPYYHPRNNDLNLTHPPLLSLLHMLSDPIHTLKMPRCKGAKKRGHPRRMSDFLDPSPPQKAEKDATCQGTWVPFASLQPGPRG